MLAAEQRLTVFDSAGTLVAKGNPFDIPGSSLAKYTATVGGFYYIAATGVDDEDFDGYVDPAQTIPHGQVGDYEMAVRVVPEPGTVALLGAGALGILSRRRKRG